MSRPDDTAMLTLGQQDDEGEDVYREDSRLYVDEDRIPSPGLTEVGSMRYLPAIVIMY